MKTHEHTRIFGLDIFRAIAILLVVFVHANYLLKDTRWDGFPYFPMVDGVDLFFVLSGFLIGGILLKELHSAEAFGIKALGRFWKRRWFRTLPNYYLVLLANYLVVHYQVINGDIHQFNWKFLFFLQNFSKPFYDFFWESWSLTVEEWFYIFSPVLLFLLLNFFSPKRSFLFVTLLMIVVPVCYRLSMRDPAIDGFWYDVTFRKLVLTRLDSIAYGLLAAWLFYYFNDMWNKYKKAAMVCGLGLLVFATCYDAPHGSFYKQIVCFSITPLSAALLLPAAQSIKTARGIFAGAVTHISRISYSMYLINLALVEQVIQTNFPPGGETDSLIKYVLYWFIVVAGSTLLYTCFEKPMMQLRDK